MFQLGLGAEQDFQESFVWLSRAHEQVEPLFFIFPFRFISFSICSCLLTVFGLYIAWLLLPRSLFFSLLSFPLSIHWQQHADAAYNLSCLYHDGLGVAHNDAESARLLQLAAARGSAPARAFMAQQARAQDAPQRAAHMSHVHRAAADAALRVLRNQPLKLW